MLVAEDPAQWPMPPAGTPAVAAGRAAEAAGGRVEALPSGKPAQHALQYRVVNFIARRQSVQIVKTAHP